MASQAKPSSEKAKSSVTKPSLLVVYIIYCNTIIQQHCVFYSPNTCSCGINLVMLIRCTIYVASMKDQKFDE